MFPSLPRWIRQVAGAVFIAVLAVSAIATGRTQDQLRADIDQNADSAGQIEKFFADVCAAAPAKNIAESGRVHECQLARAGKIEEAAPVVQPQVARPVSKRQIEEVVDAYLDNRLRELPDQYRGELRQAVVDYLRANPPKNGVNGKAAPPPSAQQIAAAVAAYVAAHPPPAGKDGKDGAEGKEGEKGADGVSVAAVAQDGCDLVFSFSNDTTVRVGPICGKDGADGKEGKQGDPGAAGRGVASQDCVAGDDVDQDGDGVVPATDWLITYDKPDTDGKTAQRVDGPCRVDAPAPPPSVSQPVTTPGLLGR